MTKLAREIKRAREAKGLSVYELSQKMDCSGPAIYSWENGNTIPSTVLWKKLSKILGIKSPTEHHKGLGAELKRYLKTRGISQRQAAKDIGVSIMTVTRCTSNKGKLRSSMVDRIKAYLKNGKDKAPFPKVDREGVKANAVKLSGPDFPGYRSGYAQVIEPSYNVKTQATILAIKVLLEALCKLESGEIK